MFSYGMDHKALKLQSLEHHVHRQLKPCLNGRGFLLLAVSGGLDSVSLLSIVSRLRVLELPPVHVVHIHHGGQSEYRDQARAFVSELCQSHNMDFHTNEQEPNTKLQSEAELRDFRYFEFERIMGKLKNRYGHEGVLLTAHHWDDQVETRLLRLIRGTGPEGFKAMSLQRGAVLRPLLETSSAELRDYAELLKLNWVEDPSNAEANAMRNWLRNEWLPALENKQPGSVRRMALSLEKVSEGISTETEKLGPKLSRLEYNSLLPSEKSKLLVRYLSQSGLRDYSSAQVSELVKRLDTLRREHRFHLLKCEWQLNAEHIWIHRD